MAKTKKKSKKLSHILEYILVKILYIKISLFPFSSLDGVALFLVFVLGPLLNAQKKRIQDNLAFAYPDLQGSERKQFIRNNLVHNFRVFLEVSQAKKFSNREFTLKHVYPDQESSIEIFLNRSRPLIVIEGHFGNWEIPVAFVSARGAFVKFAAKHMRNPYVDAFTSRLRENYGGELIYLEQSLQLMRALKGNGTIGLVADQDAGRNGVFVPFFGRQASTFAGPGSLAYSTNADVILVTSIYEGQGRYRFSSRIVYQGLAREEFPDIETATKAITQKWVAILEEEVRKNPEQYFWVHRRWKTRPPGEKS